MFSLSPSGARGDCRAGVLFYTLPLLRVRRFAALLLEWFSNAGYLKDIPDMGRYRLPQPKSSPYITRPGYEALQEESRLLWVRRREVTKALGLAAAEGDRSENAEYIYRKKELREIDRRIRYLQKRLPELKVVDTPPSDPKRIFFGAWITLEDEAGEELVYRVVGPDEFDPQKGWISMDSPLAKALLKRGLDEEVEVRTPQGGCRYYVVDVSYRS
jgi:transcription elongation factor GreB